MNDFLSEEFEIRSTPSKVHKEEFKVPTNVKQIGTIEEGIQIYLEDYVYTYLYQYARNDSEKEKLSILLGKYLKDDEQTVLMISGAIQGKFTEMKSGNITFTEETWEYVRSKQKEYFSGMEIVGWMHTQPGYGVFLTSHQIQLHKELFSEKQQVLYVIDPVEKNDSFFSWNGNELKELPGYFVYYDRNEEMHNYMLDHRVTKPKLESDVDADEDVIFRYRQQDRSRRQEQHHKKVINMLISLSGILGLICLVMGIGLVNNLERITKLETEINNMDNTYTNLFTQLKTDDVQAVMAEIVPAEDEKREDNNESKKENVEKSASEQQKKETEQQSAEEKSVEKVEVAKTEENQQEASTPVQPEAPVVEQKKEEVPAEEIIEPIEDQKEAKAPEPKTESKKEEKSYETYTIRTGDNLNKISYQHYKTIDMVDEIMKANNISNPNKIYVGQKIKLPQQ